jgi:dihydrofolate reductase
MKQYSMIAAVARNGVIGDTTLNSLLWNLPTDLKHFKEKTLGKTVIMGSRTFESIGRPLPKRRNIVITRDADKAVGFVENKGVDKCYWSLSQAIEQEDDIVVIGGSKIYWDAFYNNPPPSTLDLTLIDADFDGDVYFPAKIFMREFISGVAGRFYERDKGSHWMTENELRFQFATFKLKEPS